MKSSSTGSDPAQGGAPLRGLRVRLALGFGLLAIALTVALVLAIGELATRLAQREIGRYLTRLSIEMRDKLDVGMFERVSEIEMLATIDQSSNGARNPAVRRAFLDELRRATPDYAWLGYTDRTGRVTVSLGGVMEGVDVSALPWFRRAMEGGPPTGDVRGAKELAHALALADAKIPRIVDISLPLRVAGKPEGVVGAYVSWSWAERLREAIESYALPGAPFELLVIANDGRVLLGPAGIQGTLLARKELAPAQLQVYDAKLERWDDGLVYLTGASATRGHRGFPGLGWNVIVRQRADYAFASVRALQQRIALAGAFIAVLAIACGWWVAARVSGPLVAIAGAADAISRGRRRVQIPAGGGYSEVDRLSAALRAMLASLSRQEEDLRQAQDKLEARVRERTAELSKAQAEIELEVAEHELARDEASEAKERLSMALDASRLALWDYEVPSGKVYLSEAWSQMLGLPRAPTHTTIGELTGLVPQDERAGVARAIAGAMKGPDPQYTIEHRVHTAVGDVIWIVSEGRVVSRDPDGRALRMLGTNRDVTWRMRAAVALRESEARFRGLTELFSDWYWELDAELRFTRIEGAGLARIGVRAEEVLGGTAQAFARYELTGMSAEEFARIRQERRSYRDVRGRFSMPDGSHVYVSIAGEPVFADDGSFRGYRGVTRDITGQVRAETALAQSEARFKGAMENSAIGMALVGLDGRFLSVNRALARIVGRDTAELQALGFQDITHPEDLEADLHLLRETLAGTRAAYAMEKRYLHKLGHEVRVQLDVSLVRDADGKPLHFISQIQDISERRRMQERIEHLALHDPLTGLPNSRLLEDRLAQALAAARRARRSLGVLYMDLDGFKPVNDTHGHAAGDRVLKEFAARLKRALRESESAARVGGDEFVAVLGEVGGEADAIRAAERVIAATAQPFDLGEGFASLSVSVGIALFPLHARDGQTLLQCADTAMYEAKRSGKNCHRTFAGDTT